MATHHAAPNPDGEAVEVTAINREAVQCAAISRAGPEEKYLKRGKVNGENGDFSDTASGNKYMEGRKKGRAKRTAPAGISIGTNQAQNRYKYKTGTT